MEAFSQRLIPLPSSEESVQAEAVGNPVQTALALASRCCFEDAESCSVEEETTGDRHLRRSEEVCGGGADDAAAAAKATVFFSEVEPAGRKEADAGLRAGEEARRYYYDGTVQKRSVEKHCSGGEDESCFFFAEAEDSSRNSSSSSSNFLRGSVGSDGSSNFLTSRLSSSSGSDLRSLSSTMPLTGEEEQQQQQETTCEEVIAEEAVETVDGDSTAAEGETEANSEFSYSEETEDEEAEFEEENDETSDWGRNVVFCDAFAGLEGERTDVEREVNQQQVQQQVRGGGVAATRTAAAAAAATLMRERSKRKLRNTCEGSHGVISQEKRGKKEEGEEHFGLQQRRPQDVGNAAELRHSSTKTRRASQHAVPKRLPERGNFHGARSSHHTFHSPSRSKQRNNSSTRDASSGGGAVELDRTSSMHWYGSLCNVIESGSTSSRQPFSNIDGSSSSMMLASNSKRRSSSRSLGVRRFKVRRRVSEADTYTVRSSSRSSVTSRSTSTSAAAAAVLGDSRERSPTEQVTSPEAAATLKEEVAEVDPLERLARRTEELLLMHSKRFMEEQQKR